MHNMVHMSVVRRSGDLSAPMVCLPEAVEAPAKWGGGLKLHQTLSNVTLLITYVYCTITGYTAFQLHSLSSCRKSLLTLAAE